LSFALVALGKGLMEPPLQLGVSAPKIGYFIIKCRGHALLRLSCSRRMILQSAPATSKRPCNSIFSHQEHQVGQSSSAI